MRRWTCGWARASIGAAWPTSCPPPARARSTSSTVPDASSASWLVRRPGSSTGRTCASFALSTEITVARLDKLIQLLFERGADALRLTSGHPAALQQNGGTRPLTRDPLTDAQIVSLMREIAPAAVAEQVAAGAALTFAYAAPSGPVEAEVTPGSGGLQVLLRRGDAPAEPPSASAPAAGVDAEARAEVETLLRELSTSGASDLHLRSGEPPVFRRHGELVRTDAPPIPAARLEIMLTSLMSPANLAEYREAADVDWAWEIADVARFRCNAGRDRHGPFAVMRVIPTRVQTADELGLTQEVQNLCYLTKGLVVVTGPTGSGKSTTLAAMVDLMNRTRT